MGAAKPKQHAIWALRKLHEEQLYWLYWFWYDFISWNRLEIQNLVEWVIGMGGWMDGWVGGWIHGWMDGWVGG